MKSRFLIITILVFFSSSILLANAVPELDHRRAFDYSEIVLVGKIISTEILSEPEITKTENTYSERSGITLYEIQVEEYLKNSNQVQILTATGLFLREPHGMSYSTYPYEVGQRVLLYLQENDDISVDADLIIRAGDSKVIVDSICNLGSYFDRGLCVEIDDTTPVPTPSCKSGPMPKGEGWVFVDCEWKQHKFTDEEICGLGTELIDGICQMTIVDNAPHEVDDTFLGIFFVLFLGMIFSVIAFIVWRIRK